MSTISHAAAVSMTKALIAQALIAASCLLIAQPAVSAETDAGAAAPAAVSTSTSAVTAPAPVSETALPTPSPMPTPAPAVAATPVVTPMLVPPATTTPPATVTKLAAPVTAPATTTPVAKSAAPAALSPAKPAASAAAVTSDVAPAAVTAPASMAAQMTPEAARAIVSKVAVTTVPLEGPEAQLLSQDVVRKLTPAMRKQIQQALLQIYSEDPAYMQAYRESTLPLSDNLIGPITLSWLNRFWFEFKMEPSGNLTNASIAALLHFAATVTAHPEWKSDLISTDLGRWIASFEPDDKARYYQIRLAGTDEQIIAMLRLYHYETDNKRAPETDPDRALLIIYHYTLTAADFKLLASKSQVMAKLSALQDVVYLNQPLFDAAVLEALKDLGTQAQAYLPAARDAAFSQSYQLTLESLQALRDGKVVPDTVINAIEPLSGAYPNQASFSEAILDATAKVDAPIDQYLPDILSAAETSTSYILTARALAELNANRKNEPVPPVVLDMLKGLQDLDYPQQWLFDKAVMARLRYGIGACQSGIPGDLNDRRKISADQMKELETALRDATLFAQLDKLWQAKSCSASEAMLMPQQIEAFYIKYRASIRATARKKPVYDASKHVLWDGNGCGCVLDELNGEVYGFYPFWMAGSRQTVDFSTLSRIAYYGPTFDDTGVLRQANDGRDFVAAAENGDLAQQDFVDIAQRHQTSIDWVIQRDDWRSWAKLDKSRKEQVLERLTNSIVSLLSIKLHNWTTTISNHLPFGERFVPTNGGGVTLFFDGYPDDDVSVQVFNKFVDTLRSRLRQAKAGDGINLMMRHTAMGKGIYDYANLYNVVTASDNNRNKDFLARVERDADRRPHFMVLLAEPTTDTKKQLRLSVEQSLHGAEREAVLRQIVPVITFDHDNWQQLQDDIIYFKDNFGGVGFWPLAMNQPAAGGAAKASLQGVLPPTAGVQQCDVSMDVNQCLSDFYQKTPGAEVSVVCKTVCENLYVFRLATKLVLMLLIGCAALYYLSCKWRETMTAYYHAPAAIIGVVWMFLSLSLLFCDPFLHYLANGYMIPIFLVLFIVCLIVWYQYRIKERDEQP